MLETIIRKTNRCLVLQIISFMTLLWLAWLQGYRLKISDNEEFGDGF